jgi:hypothetical protein
MKLTPVCASVTMSASPASTAKAGTAVTITAHAAGCANPLYQFAILAPGATTYATVQAYSGTATYTWTPSTAGTYSVSVWARDTYSAGTSGNAAGRWDTYSSLAYKVS